MTAVIPASEAHPTRTGCFGERQGSRPGQVGIGQMVIGPKERLTRRTLLKAAGGLMLASFIELPAVGASAAPVRRTEWVESGVFPASGTYQSTILKANSDFNSVELGWLADGSSDAGLVFAVRTSLDGASWSGWSDLHVDHHLRATNNNLAYAAPLLTASQRYLQYRVTIPAGSGLQEIQLNAVDTSAPARFQNVQLIDGFIIPRAGWGCDESLGMTNGQRSWPPEYAPVQKIIIHHTVTQNDEPDPAATVRAVYYYHCVTLGWGDIGYNFLVDWKGNCYEGRFGGLNVIAGHALQYNHGSCGIAALGTYMTFEPSSATLASLVKLAKTLYPQVDPGVWSYFIDRPNVPNVCGHRDVLQTECPGDDLYGQLPGIRGNIKGTGPITQAQSIDIDSAKLVSVSYSPTTVVAGQPITITAVVENDTSGRTIYGQAPSPQTSYVEGMDFLSMGWDKLEGAYRVGVDFSGNQGLANPWRWGLPGPIDAGQQGTVVGYLRLNTAGTWNLAASLVQEWIQYDQQNAFPQRITVQVPGVVNPAAKSSDHSLTYFGQTNHNVPVIFANFWKANGGVSRFGYPLTEPYQEESATDGGIYLTQYFERARFEHHPKNAGTPYEVQLGLLGDEVTVNRQSETPFQPVPASAAGAGAVYFSQTSHTISGGFLDFWQNHGSVNVLGYPISEKFQETSQTDGQQHLVQYFERVRLEWHPENPAPYTFLYGQLGREILIARHWMTASP